MTHLLLGKSSASCDWEERWYVDHAAAVIATDGSGHGGREPAGSARMEAPARQSWTRSRPQAAAAGHGCSCLWGAGTDLMICLPVATPARMASYMSWGQSKMAASGGLERTSVERTAGGVAASPTPLSYVVLPPIAAHHSLWLHQNAAS